MSAGMVRPGSPRFRRIAAVVLVAALACSCRGGPAIGAAFPVFPSKLEAVLSGGSKPFTRPFDVAALSGRGEIVVADEGNKRVEIFDERGTHLRAFGQRGGGFIRFHDLRGIDVDGQGRVLCADAGRAAVIVVDSLRGAVLEQVDFAGLLPGPAPDLCDVASVDGRIMALDCRRTVVLAGRRASAPEQPQVGGGESSGRALCALEAGVRLWCAEPRTGRISSYSLEGEPLGGIETRPAHPGVSRSPTGVAIGAGGRIFVSDEAQGVVQVYDLQGGLLGLLGDEAGAALTLDGPAGLAFDSRGRLVIAESRARRVQVRRIQGYP